MDPLAEKYYGVSPYAYCSDNPVVLIDPIGLDTLKATLPADRTKQGTAQLIVNGKDITLNGGTQVLGKGTTNHGQNPNRDQNKKDGDTPTGEAIVIGVKDNDKKGVFVNGNGIPVNGSTEDISSELKAEGRFFIILEPKSGNLLTSKRTDIGFHGGGTILGKNALDTKQKLVSTLGCLRATNQTAAQIANQAMDALRNKREFRIIIVQQ